jgi:peptidoglycan-associated lipoprotein
MMIRASFAALAVMAGLAGCATPSTDSPEGSTATPSDGPQSASPAQPGRAQPGRPGQPSDPRTGNFAKRSVYYEFDVYDVKPEYRPLIEAHAQYLRQNPQASMLIEGNADERGSREYNLALGQRRAESVQKMMRLLGVRDAQVEAISYGEEVPRATGHDETAWAENRRSDFKYSK